MTDDRAEGGLKGGVGRVQDAVGGLMGDAGMQARGKLNQAAGAVQGAVGQARGQAEDVYAQVESYTRERPLAALAAAVGAGVVIGLLLRGNKTVYVNR